MGRSKLKASARASALLSGFAMVALVEIQLNSESEVPVGLLVAFVICTTLLIAVHMLSLMIATCILPHIESVAIIPGTTEYSANDGTHDRLKNYIETSWFFSTTIGIFLFLVEIDLICWVKFWNYGTNSGTNIGRIASISVTLALIPIFILFITFAVKFYRNLVTHQFEKSEREILELDTLINELNFPDSTAGPTSSESNQRPSIQGERGKGSGSRIGDSASSTAVAVNDNHHVEMDNR